VDISNNVVASCFEPNPFDGIPSANNVAIDGCCCENTTSLLAICCLVELDGSLSKSSSLL
jgi:hypothetical protein